MCSWRSIVHWKEGMKTCGGAVWLTETCPLDSSGQLLAWTQFYGHRFEIVVNVVHCTVSQKRIFHWVCVDPESRVTLEFVPSHIFFRVQNLCYDWRISLKKGVSCTSKSWNADQVVCMIWLEPRDMLWNETTLQFTDLDAWCHSHATSGHLAFEWSRFILLKHNELKLSC